LFKKYNLKIVFDIIWDYSKMRKMLITINILSKTTRRIIPRIKMNTPLYRTEYSFPGNFKGHSEEKMLKNMYEAIDELKLWDWLSTFTPEKKDGFMWSPASEISQIGNHPKVNSDGHTGASFAWCMRNMEVIAKKGWEHYYTEFVLPNISRKVQ
jgi:hypothetical protein